MRDDAVLGRALPLDRGLGPFTLETGESVMLQGIKFSIVM